MLNPIMGKLVKKEYQYHEKLSKEYYPGAKTLEVFNNSNYEM